jgi:hypothetical protein
MTQLQDQLEYANIIIKMLTNRTVSSFEYELRERMVKGYLAGDKTAIEFLKAHAGEEK